MIFNNRKGCFCMNWTTMQTLAVLVIFLLLGVHDGNSQEQEGDCSFPAYTQNHPDDETDYWDFGLMGTHLTMTFHGNQWLAWSTDGEIIMNTTCVETFSNDNEDGWSDMIVTNSTNGQGNFGSSMCLQFINRTSSVLQIKAAKSNETTDSFDCDSDLVLVDWPLVANKRSTSQYQWCPLGGGYNLFNMSSILGDDTESLCKDHPIHGLLESECTMGEGLYWTFTDYTCIPKYTGWALEQSLYCLDSWKNENNTQFTILGTDYDTPQFCMRIKDNEFVIFQDLVCPEGLPGDTTMYITMDYLKKEKTFDDCEDETRGVNCSSDGEFCQDTPYRLSCRKTCGSCFDTNTSCQYDPSIVPQKGQWKLEIDVELHTLVSTTFEFKASSFNVTSFGEFFCHKKILDHTYLNHLNVAPGCSSRYSCSKFSKVSPSVLQYKFSQFERDYEDTSDLCHDTSFHDDSAPLNNIIRSRDYNILIATDESLLNQTVDCSFFGNYTFNMSLHLATINCTGSLSDLNNCERQSTMSVIADCNGTQIAEDYQCIGTIDFGSSSSRVLITRAPKGHSTAGHCWLLDSPEDEAGPLTFYVMNSPQCDVSTLEAIESGQRHAEARVTAHRVDTCDEPPAAEVTSTPFQDVSETTAGYVTDEITDEITPFQGVSKTTAGYVTDKITDEPTDKMTTEDIGERVPTEGPVYGPSAGQVIGILIGVIAGCLLVSVLAWLGVKLYRKHKSPYRVL